MSTPHQSGSMGDELTNILMAGLTALFALILTFRGAGTVAAFLSGAAQPGAGITDGLAVLFDQSNSGKGLHIVIPAILDAPDAVVTTSERPDNPTATLRYAGKLLHLGIGRTHRRDHHHPHPRQQDHRHQQNNR